MSESTDVLPEVPEGAPLYTSESAATVADGEVKTEYVRARYAGDLGEVRAIGRRKQAIVRVRLKPGSGKFVLNGRTIEDYFPNKLHQQLVNDPFKTVERAGQFDVYARLDGGGISGQAGALRLAIARALIVFETADRPSLKKAGLLSRDARVKERKKYGLKKARKAPQYSKR
ncbi:MAG: small subunit ribosomal protein [Frankiaceae bacterium]|nr:small subunit ribosomal protein [Frankiaceae bacterium]